MPFIRLIIKPSTVLDSVDALKCRCNLEGFTGLMEVVVAVDEEDEEVEEGDEDEEEEEEEVGGGNFEEEDEEEDAATAVEDVEDEDVESVDFLVDS